MSSNDLHPRRWPRMLDSGLARSASLAEDEAAWRIARNPASPPDGAVLRTTLAEAWAALVAAWGRARERRLILRELKRVDRRMLADIGLERGQLRESVDAMLEMQRSRDAARRAPAGHAGARRWTASRSTA